MMINDEQLYFVGVRFAGSEKQYYFSTSFNDLKIGDPVVVETINGFEMAFVCTELQDIKNYSSDLELKPIARKPTVEDVSSYEFYQRQNDAALEAAAHEISVLGLPMDLLDATYNLDGSRVTITYTSPEKRVDFRELLRKLASILHCRIELRQIASRDKAKMVGGLGTCGLPMCCSRFLKTFEGISITKAKNQMLTLNVAKLSGPCGKLLCCLDYEDAIYTEARKEFPEQGDPIKIEGETFYVNSFNIISKTVQLTNAAHDQYKTYPLEDIKAMLNGTYKKPVEITDLISEQPQFEFEKAKIKEEEPKQEEIEENKSNNKQSKNKHRFNNNGRFRFRNRRSNRNGGK